MDTLDISTFWEKATWNCVENAPPEEKPLMAMVSGLMLSLSSAELEVAVSVPVITFVGKIYDISG